MALNPCKECAAKISDEAKTCPQCGAKQPQGVTLLGAVVVLLIFGFFLKAVFEGEAPVRAAQTPEQRVETTRRDKENTMVFLAVKSLKESMKKPETFELIDATMIDGAVICLQYKGRNSWNDVRTSFYVITDTVSSGEPQAWTAHCAGKHGDNYTAVRALLP